MILLAALALEFVGSELMLRRVEAQQWRSAQAEWLAEQLIVADRLLGGVPTVERDALARRLWQKPLSIRWAPAPEPTAPRPAAASSPDLAKVRPELAGRRISMESRMAGALTMADGSQILFRSTGLPIRSSLHRHASALLLLLACVALVAWLIMRMLGRPLQRLAQAADSMGHGQPRIVPVDGPREVQQVAAAFNAMQARLFDLVNDRTQALAAVSHDLRTPIARMRLRTATIGEPAIQQGFDHDLDEMEAFIASILDYLRGADAEPERLVDLASLIQTIVDDAQDAGGDARYDGPMRLNTVTRPLKLQRALSNVVHNALRHAGQARVALSADADTITILIDDDGPGIPPDQLEAVFQPFQRLEQSRSRGTGGAGLGLAIVRRSVTRLGGVVTLANRPEGGLRATIRLARRTVVEETDRPGKFLI